MLNNRADWCLVLERLGAEFELLHGVCVGLQGFGKLWELLQLRVWGKGSLEKGSEEKSRKTVIMSGV